MLGYGLDGNPIQHKDLPGVVAAEQTQRDQLAKNGATANQLKALDNVIAIHQASLKALNEHAQGVADAASQRKKDEVDEKAKQARLTNASKPQKTDNNSELNAVAYDPNYQNPDGTKGANVVMNKADAAAKGLTHYKADANKINTVVAGMNVWMRCNPLLRLQC